MVFIKMLQTKTAINASCAMRMTSFSQSALKHGWRAFLYSAMGGLVCSGQLLGKSGSEAASELQGRMARVFSSNSLMNTIDMTAAIQYILAAAQSLGSHVYYKSLE